MNEADILNYNFNHNTFLCKSMMSNLTSLADRQKVVRWMRKLSTSNRTIDEMKLRNDFMYYLVMNLQTMELSPPFNDNPPPCPLQTIAHLLPGGAEAIGAAQAEAAAQWTEQPPPEKPLLYANSPDGGAFLAAQPIPRCGAFCYLAVVSKSPKAD
ncbi:uncharacterized protein LOC108744122 [Agrilus planipennis]|uniref:Uncharacterized protein LOC108744122 n=1 Tax=Agrilus planipennis TaxID=224129 RepID=A0A1W4XRX7_AGRPL|nr:uncharacterized protein LOC108744122 [Agrilus planipennis]